jgi:hypothetical protein
MTHIPTGALVAVAISTATAVAMSILAIYAARKGKNDKKAF